MTYTNSDLGVDYFNLMIYRNYCIPWMSREKYRLMMEKIAIYPQDIPTYFREHGSLDGLSSHGVLGEKTKLVLEEILSSRPWNGKKPKKRPLRISRPNELTDRMQE